MSEAEKAAAFDVLAQALTNQWFDGRWSWWSRKPCGGEMHATREEAVAELIDWAKGIVKREPARVAVKAQMRQAGEAYRNRRFPLPLVEA